MFLYLLERRGQIREFELSQRISRIVLLRARWQAGLRHGGYVVEQVDYLPLELMNDISTSLKLLPELVTPYTVQPASLAFGGLLLFLFGAIR